MPTKEFLQELDTLSVDALKQRLAAVNAAIGERRVEEVKVLADGYAKKLAMNGFSVREGIEALKPYLALDKKRG